MLPQAKAKADKAAEKKAKQAEIDELTQQLADLRAAAASQGKTVSINVMSYECSMVRTDIQCKIEKFVDFEKRGWNT